MDDKTKEINIIKEKQMTRGRSKKKTDQTDTNARTSTSSTDGAIGDKQIRIDAMLQSMMKEDEPSIPKLIEVMESFSKQINTLASTEYIEKSLENITTEKFVSDRLTAFKTELATGIKKDFDKVYEHVRCIKDKMLQAVTELEKLKTETEGIKMEINVLKQDIQKVRENNDKLKEIIIEKDRTLKWNEFQINEQEQYSRLNNVRIYGIDDRNRHETADETTTRVVSIINEKLNLSIKMEDICIAHRLGQFRTDGNRVVICKFVRRSTKKSVIRARRNLKGSQIVIREDLTSKNAKLVQTLLNREDVKSVWSDEGKIFAILSNGNKIKLDIQTDLSRPLA